MIFVATIFICYTLVDAIKHTPIRNEWLPVISGVLGALISLGAFYIFPSIVPTTSAGLTLVYGLFSGLAATGSNQVVKQTVRYLNNKYGIDIQIPTDSEDSNDE